MDSGEVQPSLSGSIVKQFIKLSFVDQYILLLLYVLSCIIPLIAVALDEVNFNYAQIA